MLPWQSWQVSQSVACTCTAHIQSFQIEQTSMRRWRFYVKGRVSPCCLTVTMVFSLFYFLCDILRGFRGGHVCFSVKYSHLLCGPAHMKSCWSAEAECRYWLTNTWKAWVGACFRTCSVALHVFMGECFNVSLQKDGWMIRPWCLSTPSAGPQLQHEGLCKFSSANPPAFLCFTFILLLSGEEPTEWSDSRQWVSQSLR